MGVVGLGRRFLLGVSRGVSWLCWGGGGGWWWASCPSALLEVRLRGFRRAEDEVALHLIELWVVWVSHPNNPALAGVDTADGAHLYPDPVRDVGTGSHEGLGGPPPPSCFAALASFPPPSAFFSRPFSFGAGTAFDFGGAFLVWGGTPSAENDKEEEVGLSDSSSECDSNRFRFFARGGGALPPLPFLGGA